jgi:hypothetical protein
VVELGVYTPNKGKSKPEDAVYIETQDVASIEAQEGELKPKDAASAEAQKDNIEPTNRTVQKCAKARSIILRLCISTIQMDILLETTAQDIWDTLKRL